MRQGPADPGPDLRLECLLLRSGSSQLRGVCGGGSVIATARFAIAGIKASDREAVNSLLRRHIFMDSRLTTRRLRFDTLLILGILSKMLHRRPRCCQHRERAHHCRALPKPAPRERGQWRRSGCSPERKWQSPSAKVVAVRDQALCAGCPEAPAGCKVWPMA